MAANGGAGTPDHFTEDELRRIASAFMEGADNRFYGSDEAASDRMIGYCVWCRRRVTIDGLLDDAAHAANCEGMARLRLAAKARRMQTAVKMVATLALEEQCR